MDDSETSKSGMMRIIAWFLLTMLVALITFAAPLSFDGQELSTEDSVGVSASPDSTPFGPDVVPLAVASVAISAWDVADSPNLTEHELPNLAHFRTTLLRYAPKHSPPHAT